MLNVRTSLLCCNGLLWLFLATTASAADQELLDILLANGAITQAQYEHLLRKPTLERADVDQVVVTLNEKGFRVKSADQAHEIKIGARLHAEAAAHRGDDSTGFDATDGTELRRARMEMSGKFARFYQWAAEVDFADNDTAIKDFRIGYWGIDGAGITLGHQKQPYSLSLEMSSNDIAFIERGIDAFLVAPIVDRAIGARVDWMSERWFAAAGVFGDSVSPPSFDSDADPAGVGDESWGMAGRLVFTPVREADRVVHIALRAAYRELQDSRPTLRLRDETTHFSNLRIVNTGALNGVSDVTLFGPEFAFAHGPLSVLGEYNMAKVDRPGDRSLDFDSWHLSAAYALTGETLASAYRISSGEFGRLHPATKFGDNGGRGALEIAARLASIDLNDGPVTGGTELALTTALNWYLNANSRLMFDWTRILDTDGSNTVRREAEGLDIFAIRAQYTY